jgi:putative cell wall-binding protein
MKTKNRFLAGAAVAASLLLGGTAAASATGPGLPGLECESVFTGGGWISFCTDADPVSPVESVTRIAGTDRYQTSALLSQETFEPGVPVVYIANGATLVDALGAGAASGGAGPVLVVPRDGTLPESIATELGRLDPASIVIMGDPQSVSEAMADQVTEAAAQ